MNLWFRLVFYILTLPWRARLTLPGGVSVLHFRVWPTDLDLSFHLNNGRYLTLMDIGRLDMIASSGLARVVLGHRWTPIASAIKIRFRRELRLFEAFRIETRILAWDEFAIIMEQVFLFDSGARKNEVAARALFKGGIYDRKQRAFVPIARLMKEIGVEAESPAPGPEVEAFLAADEALKAATPRPG